MFPHDTRVNGRHANRAGGSRDRCRRGPPSGRDPQAPVGRPCSTPFALIARLPGCMPTAPMILVTGGAGFIGSNFVLDWLGGLRRAGRDPRQAHLRRQPRNLESLAGDPRHTFVHGDIADRDARRAAPGRAPRSGRSSTSPPRATSIARSTAPRISWPPTSWARSACSRRPGPTWRASRRPTGRPSGFCMSRPTRSTARSPPTTRPSPRASQYRPNSPYAASKAASDHLVRGHHHTFGLPVVTTNCSNNYGPWQFPEKLIPLCIHRALAGEPLPIYGDGRQVRDWLYVGDHCPAIRRALEAGRPGEVYNIGGSSEMANIDVVTLLCQILDEEQPAGRRQVLRRADHLRDRPARPRPPLRDRPRARSRLSSAGSRPRRSPRACGRPSAGISTMPTGWPTSPAGPTATGSTAVAGESKA